MRRSPRTAIQAPASAASATATLTWTKVVELDFAQEANQSISGGKLTFTNRVDNSTIEFDAANGASVSSGVLLLTTSAGAQIGIATTSTDTAARVDAVMATIYPAYDSEAIIWAAGVATAPTFAETSEAWGVMVNGPVRMGGGAMGWGYSFESRYNGTNTVPTTRWQASNLGTQTISSAARATATIGVVLDGTGAHGITTTVANDINDPTAVSKFAAIGCYGQSSGGTPIGGTTRRLGVFACAGAGAGPNISITKIVLYARLPTVV